jgi:hypothetical protein
VRLVLVAGDVRSDLQDQLVIRIELEQLRLPCVGVSPTAGPDAGGEDWAIPSALLRIAPIKKGRAAKSITIA